MESILKDMYHGRLQIQENMILPEVYNEKRHALVDAQEALLDALDEKTRRECLRVMEMQTALSAIETETAYVEGMKMGARMALELLEEK